jgi:hypothetical protein
VTCVDHPDGCEANLRLGGYWPDCIHIAVLTISDPTKNWSVHCRDINLIAKLQATSLEEAKQEGLELVKVRLRMYLNLLETNDA